MGSEHKILCLSLASGYHILWCLGGPVKLSKGYGGNFRSVASWGGGEGGLVVVAAYRASCPSSACPCQTGDRCSTTEWAGKTRRSQSRTGFRVG